jgi:hypothetical protein
MQLTLLVEVVREGYRVKKTLTVILISILQVDDYAQVALTYVQHIREQDVVAVHRVNPAASLEFLELRSDHFIFPLVKVWVPLELVGEAAATRIVNHHVILLQDENITFRVKHDLALRFHII